MEPRPKNKEEIIMECPVCHNEMENKLIKHYQQWNGQHVIFEGVPALVCTTCKETLFTSGIVDTINETLWNMPKANRREEVNVYELSDITEN